jgi:hypothetical protein
MNILGNMPNRHAGAAVPVRHADQLTPADFFRHHILLNRPCLIVGAVKKWRAAQSWNCPGDLAEKVGGAEVPLYRHSNYVDARRMALTEQRLEFAEAMRVFAANRGDTLSMPSILCSPTGPFAPLLDDLGEFSFIRRLPPPVMYPSHRFFIYCGAGTGWHFHDADETLMCQVKGSKRVALLPRSIQASNGWNGT